MALKDFKLIQAGNGPVDKVQENVRTYVNQLNPIILSGVIIKDIELLAASTINVPHLLGRQWQGWQVLDQNAGSIIWRDSSSTEDGAKFLPLKTSADVTVNLWVF